MSGLFESKKGESTPSVNAKNFVKYALLGRFDPTNQGRGFSMIAYSHTASDFFG